VICALCCSKTGNRLSGQYPRPHGWPARDAPVDTGFIVFNCTNYPHRRLNDPVGACRQSNMSFGASFDGGRLEYALASLMRCSHQRRNTANPISLRMITACCISANTV
jgi:predicted NAD/FAD-binding protein